jgi:hypothetical protein
VRRSRVTGHRPRVVSLTHSSVECRPSNGRSARRSVDHDRSDGHAASRPSTASTDATGGSRGSAAAAEGYSQSQRRAAPVRASLTTLRASPLPAEGGRTAAAEGGGSPKRRLACRGCRRAQRLGTARAPGRSGRRELGARDERGGRPCAARGALMRAPAARVTAMLTRAGAATHRPPPLPAPRQHPLRRLLRQPTARAELRVLAAERRAVPALLPSPPSRTTFSAARLPQRSPRSTASRRHRAPTAGVRARAGMGVPTQMRRGAAARNRRGEGRSRSTSLGGRSRLDQTSVACAVGDDRQIRRRLRELVDDVRTGERPAE